MLAASGTMCPLIPSFTLMTRWHGTVPLRGAIGAAGYRQPAEQGRRPGGGEEEGAEGARHLRWRSSARPAPRRPAPLCKESTRPTSMGPSQQGRTGCGWFECRWILVGFLSPLSLRRKDKLHSFCVPHPCPCPCRLRLVLSSPPLPLPLPLPLPHSCPCPCPCPCRLRLTLSSSCMATKGTARTFA